MSEMNIKLQGWHAVFAIIVLAGLMGARLMTFRNQMGDTGLMQSLRRQLASDYMPKEAAQLQAAVNSSDQQDISDVVQSISSIKPEIESVKISAPLLKFSYPENVVVRVRYYLTEGGKTSSTKTLYFLYSYTAIGDVWVYQHQTTAMKYYLNFT